VVVTICSNPDGVQLTVDGTEVEGPLTTEWSEGSQHTIAAPESVMAAGARSRFAGWSDGGDLAHDVITPSAAAVYTATYARSYELRAIAADAGRGAVVVEPQSRDGFYAENATVTLTATAQPGYCFAGWTGLIGGTPAQASFSLTGPLEIAATFEAGSYSLTSALDYATVNGGEFRIGVEANDGCVWKAETSEPWISITSADTTSGSGVVEVSLSENGSRRTRVGRVHIGATEWTVVQLAR
jgi:Divergent InlB B-repeat domain